MDIDKECILIIEHIGISVSNPTEMAKWYQDNLSCKILFMSENDNGDNAGAFISDESDSTILELFKLPNIAPIKNELKNPLQLHVAFKSQNPDEDCKRLIKVGATFIEECLVKHEGEKLLLLKDPWGNIIQLVKRGKNIDFDRIGEGIL